MIEITEYIEIHGMARTGRKALGRLSLEMSGLVARLFYF